MDTLGPMVYRSVAEVFQLAKKIQSSWDGGGAMPDCEALHTAYESWCQIQAPVDDSLTLLGGEVYRKLRDRIAVAGRYALLVDHGERCSRAPDIGEHLAPILGFLRVDHLDDAVKFLDPRPLKDVPGGAEWLTHFQWVVDSYRSGATETYWKLFPDLRNGEGRIWEHLLPLEESWSVQLEGALKAPCINAVSKGLKSLFGEALKIPEDLISNSAVEGFGKPELALAVAAGRLSAMEWPMAPGINFDDVSAKVRSDFLAGIGPVVALMHEYLCSRFADGISLETLQESEQLRSAVERELGREVVSLSVEYAITQEAAKPVKPPYHHRYSSYSL